MRRTTLFARFRLVLGVWLGLGLLSNAPVHAQAVPAGQGLVADSAEVHTLRQFYYNMGGANWNNRTNWTRGTTLADVATWYGVTVADGDVVGLALPANNLQPDYYPPYLLYRLKGLQRLNLSNNTVDDYILYDLHDLPRLEEVNLAYCRNYLALSFQGLATCPLVRVVQLHGAWTSGRVDARIGQLKNLEVLDLGKDYSDATSSRAYGSLPPEIGNCRALRELKLGATNIGGTIPASIGRLQRLEVLDLAYCLLDGPLPDSLGACQALRVLNLPGQGWGLTGTLRPLAPLTNLVRVDVSRNELTGPLPPGLGHNAQLVSLKAWGNHLTGGLPVELAQCAALQELDVRVNQLSGPLPAFLGQLPHLTALLANYNRFSGPLPAGPGQFPALQRLTLAGNRLSGPLPAALVRLSALVELRLDDNNLTDVEDLGGATGLPVALALAGNYLDYAALERLYAQAQQPRVAAVAAPGQRPLPTVDTVSFVPNQLLRVEPRRQAPHAEQFQWQRLVGGQWADVPGETQAALRSAQAPAAAAGTYRRQEHDGWFTPFGLAPVVLYSAAIYADALPYPPLTRNRPDDVNTGPALAPLSPAPDAGAAAPADMNFVRTWVPRIALTDPLGPATGTGAPPAAGDGPGWTVDQAQLTTQYLDGLGRPIQTVGHQASPRRRDLVQPQAYDGLGREPRQYLPYAADTAGVRPGSYRPWALTDQQAFYRSTGVPNGAAGPPPPTFAGAGVARTGAAFAETLFEASPLNRVVAQGAAGEAWQLTAGHVVERAERPNTAADSVLRFAPGYAPNVVDPGYRGFYAAGELWGTDVADAHGPNETGAHGYRTVEWKDKGGHLVGRHVEAGRAGPANNLRSRWLRTAYAYDDFGHLRYVLQPEGAKAAFAAINSQPAQLVAGGALPAPTAPFLFHYRYDGRGRQIVKQVPGTDGETLVVFDQLDRPVLSQDAAQRARREWSWTKYDALGRIVLSGLVIRGDTAGQVTLQRRADADTAAAHQYEQRTADGAAYPHFVTTDQAFPQLNQQGFGPGTVLSVTCYDDYNFDNDAAGVADASYNTSTDGQFPTGTAPVADALRTTGMTTCTKTRVLGVDPADATQAAWLVTTTFYDERARPVQVQTTNARKGLDLLTTQFNFPGQVVQSVAVHEGPNHAPVTVAEFFVYDHAGRLLSTRQQLPGEARAVRIDSVAYNEIGQVVQKTMGTGRLAQTVKYAYNVRGWLTQLNDPAYPMAGDLFHLSLHYEQGFTTGYEQYNGNLTGQTWRSGRDGVQRAYGYVYDPLNRLLQGDFVARTALLPATPSAPGLWKSEEDNYRLSFASYDDNGNLLTLRRRGLLANATHTTAKQFGPVDALTYAYAGNRLQVVDDAVTGNQLPRPRGYEGAPTSLAGDFQEGGTHLAQEYLYDANGNLTQDRNKGITGIAYNHLNLPRLIRFGLGADSIVFRYTAAGQKVAKLVYQTGKPVGRTDYLGPYQYEQDSLRFFPHAEGRVLRVVSYDAARQPTVRYQREFTFKDHLGNLRLAYRAGQVRTLTATLNLDDAAAHRRETQQFDSVSVSAPVAFRVGPALARSDGYVARLNAGGSAPQPLGPLTQFAVQKGDTLRVTAPGLYPQPASNNTFAFSLAGFVASLLSPAPGAPAGADGTRRGGLPLLQVGLNSAALLALRQLPGGVPKGYLRVLSFNEDSVLVDQRTVQLTAAALNNYETLATGPLVVQQTGYVSVYVGNESAVDVYFDDLTVEHRQGLQVQENQYDPFGLSLTGLDYNTSALKNLNMKQFNGQEKIIDLGLCLYTYRYREYDFQLGRFSRVDPLAEKFPYLTTYQFASNSPIWLRELEGLEGVRYTDVDGTEGVRKNVVVLLEPLKQAGVGSSQKEIDHVNNQNALIERRNASTLSIIRAETSQYLDNNGKGSKDSNGNTIRVTTNVIGIPDFDKKGMTRSQVDNKYTQISREYGEKGTKFDKFGASLDINAGAAVITREGSGGAQGSTVNNIIRLNFNGPEGTRSHEIGHSLGLNDNGYKIGGILNNPPMQLISPEVDVITRESYQSIAPAPSPPVLP